jgi:hypothetical protein
MNKKLVKSPSKEDFINHVDKVLTQREFVKDPEKDLWVRKTVVVDPEAVVIINGQRQQSNPIHHHIEMRVEIIGEGNIKDADGENVHPFIEVDFSIVNDGNVNLLGPTFCIPFDDHIQFNHILAKLFKL